MLVSYHLLYFCTALSLIIMLSSHYHHHKSKTFSQLTQCPFTGTLLLSGSHTDLEGAADNLFASPPCPQPLRFGALSLKTPPKPVPPTPGTALQQKIESNFFLHSSEMLSLNRYVHPEPKNIRTNTNTRFGPNIFLSHHPQRRISPLLTRKGLLSPLGPLLN